MAAANSTQSGGGETQWIALLGRRDEPADGVEDYCDFLGQALRQRGIELRKARVGWRERGWLAALGELWRESAGWGGRWVLLQYTALGWSRRGFPLGALTVAWILRRRGARCSVVFHEASGQPSKGAAGKLREGFQDFVVRHLHRRSAKSIFTVQLSSIDWLNGDDRKAAFVPIGANIPETHERSNPQSSKMKTVVVFCLTPGPNRQIEVQDVLNAVRVARGAGIPVRLVVLGRSTAEVREEFERALAGSGAEVAVLGMLPANEVAQILCAADAQLFVCGCVSQRRGSALAGVSCGLPIVGYAGAAEGTEIEQAGLELAPYRDPEALGKALIKVLTDDELNARLRERSRAAHALYFSWKAIAEKYQVALGERDSAEALRVLIYTEYFLPVIGGVQTAVNLLARGLSGTHSASRATGGAAEDTRDVRVTLVTRTREQSGGDSEFPFHVVRHPGLRRFLKMIREADVIHVAGPCLAPMAIAWLLGKPFVVEHHGYQAICPNGLLFMQPSQTACPGHFTAQQYGECLRCRAATAGWLGGLRSVLLTFPRHWLSSRAAANIGITQHVCNRHVLPRSRAIYYGIERAPMTSGNGSTATQASKLEVAYVGRLVAEKGLPLLLDAGKRLKEEGVQFHLTFIGDGPERALLEKRVNDSGLRSAVTFTGDLRGPALERAVEKVAVVVMPSVWEETAGLSAIEQMMRGRIVVAAEIGGLGEVVGDAGLKFPPRDSGALAARLREAVLNREEMSRLGRTARERAEGMFSVERMVREHRILYREVCGVEPPGRENLET